MECRHYFAFSLLVLAIALHYLSTFAALSRARVPVRSVRFGLPCRKVIAQQEGRKRPNAAFTEAAFAIAAAFGRLSISCLS